MLNKILRLVITLFGIAIGPGIVLLTYKIIENFTGSDMMIEFQSWISLVIIVGSAILSGLIFLFLSNRIALSMEKGLKSLEESVSKASPVKITSGVIGLVIGLVIAGLLSVVVDTIPITWIVLPVTVILYIVFGFLGWSMGYTRKLDFSALIQKNRKSDGGVKEKYASPKVLDTSAIIDGRIYDICKTGVFEGDIVIPSFVLTELQHIADSADSMKRTKGRRGLDILHKMQQELDYIIKINNTDYDDVAEVDTKLIRLAKELGGKVVTTDFNLNKVATVYKVDVFNINDLANAVKPVLLPGEELRVIIVKDGKEQNQGIAYLDDGTMIVVEGAKGRSGDEMDVVVTSVLQTSAGRMIFAKIK